MNRIIITLVLVAIGATTSSGQSPDKQPKGFFSTLKVGQVIAVKEVAGRYEISMIEGVPGPLGHKVIEIGTDYLVVENFAGVIETRIPVFSIKAIIKIKVPRK
jgi:hypothetical protein